MFCKNCGISLADGTKFCNGCGANQEGEMSSSVQPKVAYIAPKFEFKTVQCYPNNSTEEKYKSFYEDCGWQILDMDRKQVYTGQDYDGTKNYSTQTHIKMQRDKNHPNYDKIKELSDKAEAFFGKEANTESYYPKKKPSLVLCFIAFIFYIIPLPIYLLKIRSDNKKIAALNMGIEARNKEKREKFDLELRMANDARKECRELANNL